ncbi:MAG: MarR family transcriptional regulator [Oscillospiraceae bacterium]|nr:MarR family transcriptional regulator [Oscillospiraceae bacterium]
MTAAKPYVAVVGAVNVDLWGRSFVPLVPRDSNPGEVRVSFGGVGRNIAHNLRLLGAEVELLTALGGDAWAEQVEADCRSLGIGLNRALRLPEARTGSYLYISGPDGDLALAVCDTDIARYINAEALLRQMAFLNGAAAVVFDGNLTPEALDCLTEQCTAPLFADPVSVTKARKLAPVLGHIHTLKPNALEAAALTGEADPARAAEALAAKGVGHAFVSDGAGGLYLAEGAGVTHFPCPPTRLVNATGGGDAAMAALAQSFVSGLSSEQAARRALAAGSLAVECEETINPALSEAALAGKMGV